MRSAFEQKINKSLGKTFVAGLHDVKLVIGKTEFTHQQMIDLLGCGNFAAAARLTKVLKRLGVTTIPMLRKLDPASLFREKNVGMTTVYVAMCVLDAHQYDVEEWWGWKQQKDNVVKFSTYKHKLLQRTKRREVKTA